MQVYILGDWPLKESACEVIVIYGDAFVFIGLGGLGLSSCDYTISSV